MKRINELLKQFGAEMDDEIARLAASEKREIGALLRRADMSPDAALGVLIFELQNIELSRMKGSRWRPRAGLAPYVARGAAQVIPLRVAWERGAGGTRDL